MYTRPRAQPRVRVESVCVRIYVLHVRADSLVRARGCVHPQPTRLQCFHPRSHPLVSLPPRCAALTHVRVYVFTRAHANDDEKVGYWCRLEEEEEAAD